MKKIVGIMAAVAMAASLFAVDFSANVKVEGSAFNMTLADGEKPTALSVSKSAGGMYWGSRFQTAFYGDRAGAQFAIGGELGWGWQGASLWINPNDMFKVTFLNSGVKLNQIFDYSGDEPTFATGDKDWNFEIKPVAGLTMNVVLPSAWLNAGTIGETNVKVAYSADFGTIGAILKANNNFKDIGFGVGYTGSFDNISMFADVGMSALNASAIVVDAQVVANLNPMTISAYVMYKAKDVKERVKLAYALDGCTAYVTVNDADLLGKVVNTEIQPGVEFNVGAAHCDIGLKVALGKNVAISVPFYAEVGF